MKIVCLEYIFCAFNLLQFTIHQIEAISREIAYPLGTVLGKPNLNRPVHSYVPVTQTLISGDPNPVQTKVVKKIIKYKRKPRKRKMKHSNRSEDRKNEKKKRRNKKKNVKRKDFVSRSTLGDDARKPVDIIVHIKMQE